MKDFPIPKNETERLRALRESDLLDTLPEENFDRLTRLAAEICEVPICLISLVDENRQWFKSKVGLDAEETPREISFCQYAIMDHETFIVENATKDIRFSENILVKGDPNIRFYAGHPLTDKDGHNLGTLCVIDKKPKKLNTHQQRALRILADEVISQIEARKYRLENKKYQKFFEMSLDFFCIAGTDGYIRSMNEVFEKKLGWTLKEIASSPFVDFVHEEDKQKTIDETMKLAEGHTAIGFQNRYRTKSGDYLWLDWTCQPDSETGELFAVAHDVTKLITTLNEVDDLRVRNSEELTAIDNALIRMEFSPDGKINKVNENFKKIFGYDDSLIGKEHKELLFDDEVQSEEYVTFWADLRKGIKKEKEFRRKKKNGQPIWIKGTYIPVLNGKGEVSKIIKLAYDVTEKIQFETKLQESNEQLDQFAYIVSHDLKAPLRAIGTLSTFLEEDLEGKLDEETKNNFNLLKSRVSRMENLINGILDYSRVGKSGGEKTLVDVNRILNRVAENLNIDSNFKVEFRSDFPKLNFVEIQLEQIFQNLIGNGIKYHDKESGTIKVEWNEDGSFYCFKVSDDGPGIEPEYRDKVFEIFQTLQSRDKIESTGVGLSIVKKIIEKNGGEIWIESNNEGGSTFSFTIRK